jgi:hypothetical protein
MRQSICENKHMINIQSNKRVKQIKINVHSAYFFYSIDYGFVETYWLKNFP